MIGYSLYLSYATLHVKKVWVIYGEKSMGYWRASEASETLSGLFNRESRIYILSYIYYYIYIVRANFVLITRKEGGA